MIRTTGIINNNARDQREIWRPGSVIFRAVDDAKPCQPIDERKEIASQRASADPSYVEKS